MFLNLDSMLGLSSPAIEWQAEVQAEAWARSQLREVGFVTAWEMQSQLAAFTGLALVAFAPLLAAMAVMIAWSLAATCLYAYARRKGLPDLLDARFARPRGASRRWWSWLGSTGLTLAKTWVAGLQPFLYSRTFCRVLARPCHGWRVRTARIAVLGVGLTLFGVTTAHHILRKAGLSEDKVLRVSFVGSVLNVSYRVLLSAIVIRTAMGVLGPLAS